MPRRSVISPDDETEINLSPMIDCIFILLIFFIVTTVFVEEQGLQVNKPDAAALPSVDESERVILEITQQNEILMDERTVGLADVMVGIKERVSDPEIPVVIRAHEKSSHGVFVSVWDAARRAGAVELSYSTVN